MTRTDPILLVGAQRSGTTALAGALSQAIAETGGCFTINGKLPYLLRRWWTEEDADARHLRSDEIAHALTRVAPGGVCDGWLKRAQEALLAGARRGAMSRVSVLDEVRRICAEAYGAGIWGDKYNEYLLDLPWLDAAFPAARWVFLTRDPAESVASMLAWRHEKAWNPREATAASLKWAHWTARWLAFRDKIPQRRRIELDYAKLCGGSHQALSEFIGIDLSPHLTTFQSRSSERPHAPITPQATEVRTALQRLGLLIDSGATARHEALREQGI